MASVNVSNKIKKSLPQWLQDLLGDDPTIGPVGTMAVSKKALGAIAQRIANAPTHAAKQKLIAQAKSMAKGSRKKPSTRVTREAGKKPAKKVKKAKTSPTESSAVKTRQAPSKKAPAKKPKSKTPKTRVTEGVKKAKEKDVSKSKMADAGTAGAAAGVGASIATLASERAKAKASKDTFNERDAKNKQGPVRDKIKRSEIDEKAKPRISSPKAKIDSSAVKERKEKPKHTGSDALTFGQAFRVARNSGTDEFTWRGKKFHTRTRDEENKKAKEVTEASRKETPVRTPGGKVKIDNTAVTERKPETKRKSPFKRKNKRHA